MRAVVVEINNRQAAVLSDDGSILSVKNDNYEIGQIIQISAPKQNHIIKKITAFAVSAAACLLLGVSAWAYVSPYTYVSVDVNPSIEFSVNRFNRVIQVNAVNDDGAHILQELSYEELTNKSITDAITRTVEQISEAGYFNGEAEGGIVIATSSENSGKAEKLATELKETVEQEIKESGDSVVVEAFSVGLEQVTKANELGVTPGKLNLVEKLQEAADRPEDIALEEWLDKPVKDIMKATKEFRKENEDSQSGAVDNTLEDNSGDPTDSGAGVKENHPKDKGDNSKASGKADNDADKASKNKSKDADKARKDADKAQKDADKAQKDAGKAQKDADKAQKDADKAQKDADKALKNTDKAQKNSDKAQKNADLTQQNADKPLRNSDKPLKNSDKPLKNSDKPQKNSDKAKKNADKTQKESDKAGEKSSDKGPKGNK